MNKRRMIGFLSAIVLLLAATAGCRPQSIQQPSQDGVVRDHYRMSWTTVSPEEGWWIQSAQLTEKGLYFETVCSDAGSDAIQRIFYLPHGEVNARCLYQVEQDREAKIMSGFVYDVAADGSVWVLEQQTALNGDGGMQVGAPWFSRVYLKQVDVDGTVKAEALLREGWDENYVQGRGFHRIAIDNTGRLYLTESNSKGKFLYWMNREDLTLEKCMETGETYVSGFDKLKNGEVVAKWYDTTSAKNMYSYIDTENGRFGEAVEDNDTVRRYVAGTGYVELTDDAAVLCGEKADGSKTELLRWEDYALEGQFNDTCVLEDGTVLVLQMDGGCSLGRFTPCTAEEAAQTVEVWGYSVEDIDKLAKVYNRTQSDYIVKVKDYRPKLTDKIDELHGTAKLNAELQAGNVPDLLCLSGDISGRVLAAQGALQDLRPYLKADAVVNEDYFVDGFLEALEMNGELYQMATGFSLQSMIAKKSVVGDIESLSYDTLDRLQKEHPEIPLFFSDYSRDKFMEYVQKVCVGDFMDWQTRQCRFDSAAFVRLLTMAKTLPTLDEVMDSWKNGSDIVSEEDSLQNGDILLSSLSMTGVYQYHRQQSLFGDDIAFVGLPTENGVGNAIVPSRSFAVMTNADQKDGAWQFLRWMLANENDAVDPSDMYAAFPASEKAFETVVAFYQAEEQPLTNEEVAQLRKLIKTAKSAIHYDEQVDNIITAEASYFFNGKCTAQEAAAKIQSRVQVYMNEQY